MVVHRRGGDQKGTGVEEVAVGGAPAAWRRPHTREETTRRELGLLFHGSGGDFSGTCVLTCIQFSSTATPVQPNAGWDQSWELTPALDSAHDTRGLRPNPRQY